MKQAPEAWLAPVGNALETPEFQENSEKQALDILDANQSRSKVRK